jgi:glycosyltransferase involved in cell wall biosynthesis
LVTISRRLAAAYEALGAAPEKILVLPDATDTSIFERPERLPPNPYPNGGPIAVYSGHLYDWKGIPTVLEAAKLLPDAQFHLVGGFPEDIQRQRERANSLEINNVFFHGMKMHVEVPPYLWHADVLLLPPSGKHPSAQWTSPVKLGEYLASGTPVVATSIPALRDWLSDKEVEFVTPDDAASLAAGIRRLLEDREYSDGLARAAQNRAAAFSVAERARKILEAAVKKKEVSD